MTLYGSYPATLGVLDWLSNRLDAVDYSSFKYWFERRKMIEIADKVSDGELSIRAAQRLLDIYNRQTDQMLSLDELWDMDDMHVFSPHGDWIVYSDNIRGILKESDKEEDLGALDALARGPGARWVVLFQTEEHTVHALKTPHIDLREINQSADRFAYALQPGTEKTFVLPPEVHGLIKQENEHDHHG